MPAYEEDQDKKIEKLEAVVMDTKPDQVEQASTASSDAQIPELQSGERAGSGGSIWNTGMNPSRIYSIDECQQDLFVRLESGFSVSSLRLQNSVSLAVQDVLIPQEDQGQGFEEWLQQHHLERKQIFPEIVHHALNQICITTLLCIPCGAVIFAFAQLCRRDVEEWRQKGSQILSDQPLVAGFVGEPFQELSASNLYSTFAVLQVLCSILCCQTKMFGHLYIKYGRIVMPALKFSLICSAIMTIGNMLSAVGMQLGETQVPRICWMSINFVLVFLGIFLSAREASRVLEFQQLVSLYSKSGILANCVLYLYALFLPFWFFGTTDFVAKCCIAIGVHPLAEFGVYFLHQHCATFYKYNDPGTSFYMAFHYVLMLEIYGSFLLVNFEETWQNILAVSILRLWSVVSKVFAQEITFLVYRYLLRYTFEDTVDRIRTLRFKRFKMDFINLALILENSSIITAAMVTVAFNFSQSTGGQNSGESAAVEISSMLATIGMQIAIGSACDILACYWLARRQHPWHKAWRTRRKDMIPWITFLYTVGLAMFLVYFSPFLCSRMVL